MRKKEKGFVLSTYVYILLVFFLLLLGTMLAVLNNTKLLSTKMKEVSQSASGLIDKDYSFVLLGNKEEVIRKEEYEDAGFIAKTVNGIDLTEYVITENNVDTSKVGDYEISYKVTYNGVTKELSRIVHVFDNVGVNYINSLYEYRRNENGLIIDDTIDENLRYAGSNEDVKNYVEFGNTEELWRIIGVFNVASEIGEEEKRIKLVRDELLVGKYSWDSSADGTNEDETAINRGYGINQWGESTYEDRTFYEGADLMRLLNGYYIKKEGAACKYCNNLNQSNCENECTSSVIPLNGTSIDMIVDTLWELGAPVTNTKKLADMYDGERGTQDGKTLCRPEVSDGACNDAVVRSTQWKGKVGLIYPSDYGYASADINCANNVLGSDSTCGVNNWLHLINGYYWTISPNAFNDSGSVVWGVNANNNILYYNAYNTYSIRPSVYLNKDVKIISGTGTKTDPYKLSL